VCVPAGYVISYWNRAFFPEWCGTATLDDPATYDTMSRIAGSFRGISQAFKVVVDLYGWTHIVLVSDDDTSSFCWYGARPFEEVFDHDENYTFTWIRFGDSPTDEQLDDILKQIRSLTRGFSVSQLLDSCSASTV